MSAGYKTGQRIVFGGYAAGTKPEDVVFAKGDIIVLEKEDKASGTNENSAFIGERTDGKQGYLFSSEIGELAPLQQAAVEDASKGKEKAAQAQAPKAAPKTAKKAEAKPKAKPSVKASPKAVQAPKPKAATQEKGGKETEAPLVHAPSVAKLLGHSAVAALKSAKEVADRIGGDFYTLGGLLLGIKEEGYYESVVGEDGEKLEGQPGFETYIAQELGIEYRMAMHYIGIYEVTRRAGIPEDKVRGLKFSKVLALLGLVKAGAIDKANWDKWAAKARTLKGEAYKAEIEKAYVDAKIAKGKSRGVTANQVRFMFTLFDDRARVVEKALKMAQKKLPPNEDGSEHSLSEAFDLIVSEWITQQG